MNGYLYIAADGNGAEEARSACRRLKHLVPNAHATLIAPFRGGEPFDNTLLFDGPPNQQYKLKALTKTPYRSTVFMDNDTWCVESPEQLFVATRYADIGMSLAPNEPPAREPFPAFGRTPLQVWQTGVIVYRSDAAFRQAAKLYETLPAEFLNGHPSTRKPDQPFVTAAIYEVQDRVAALSQNWNFRFKYAQSTNGRVSILHGRLSDSHFNSYEEIARAVNESTDRRLWDRKRVRRI